MRVFTNMYVRMVRVYFFAITDASTSSFCVGCSSSSDFEESQGGAATATSLLDVPKLSELGRMNFFRHNDNNSEHNTIGFGEML